MPLRCFLFLWLSFTAGVISASAINPDLREVAEDSVFQISATSDRLRISWPVDDQGATARATFRLQSGEPLIESLVWQKSDASPVVPIARDLQPFNVLTVGSRTLEEPKGWVIFFDKTNTRPSQRFPAKLTLKSVRASTYGSRAAITFGQLQAGSFRGELVFTFYAGSPLIQSEAVLTTAEDAKAILYDAGLVANPGEIKRFQWVQPGGSDLISLNPAGNSVAQGEPRATRFRTLLAETTHGGTIAVFPAPHRFLYPLDFADNFGFNLAGRDYPDAPNGDSWGVRQPPDGDKRYVPWVNAPPGTTQRLGVFYWLSPTGPKSTLPAIKQLTHHDSYPALPGYKTFTSHFHVEHTLDLIKQRKTAGIKSGIPDQLVDPGFVRAFKAHGVDIVHLAEFHKGKTKTLETKERLEQLRLLHHECARLSDEGFLLLPGEEPNVHLGGHWISFFPRPILWVLHRPDEAPFKATNEAGETIYHVGSADDVLELMGQERGLMWTAHARIKSSAAYPDTYRHEAFFNSPHFLGAAWKPMPADYSRDTLGWRVLDLLDDMNNWGPGKQVLGEVDVFKVEPDYELYGHMNINYVELDEIPRFGEGWQPLLDTLREGEFFTTTGEILLTEFNAVPGNSRRATLVSASLDWTFPLSHAEVFGGDGESVFRHRIDLSNTRAHGTQALEVELPPEFTDCHWVRLEVWDIAANGAFTQPAHFK